MRDKLIFLDTEATGNDPKTDRLCQVSYKVFGKEIKTRYFKPPIPISVKAMSITHITNKAVADKESFAGSEMKKELESLIKDGVLVAHTALFDIAMLKNEGVEIPRFIDTLRVVRYLDPDNKVPEHNLQFLRYFLDLEVKGTAHDAEGDVNVLEALFERLLSKMAEEEGGEDKAINKMIEVSSRPTLFKNFIFGKHKGKPIEEILQTDRRYMEWLLGQMKSTESDTDEDWVYTLEYYLKKSNA